MMELRTDTERLTFLLEAEAELADFLADGELSALAADRPKYITNYIGSKQKLVDWIWANTPDGVETAADLFSGSSVVGYMYKSKGLAVVANDRLRYCYHIARAIVENDGETLTRTGSSISPRRSSRTPPRPSRTRRGAIEFPFP